MKSKREPEMSLESGILIATKAHRGQVDKGGNPYIMHPLRVMLDFLRPNIFELPPYRNEDFALAAVLHDVVEDSDWTLDGLLQARAPMVVLEALDHLTRRKESGESYGDYIERLRHNPIALQVKLRDLADNLAVTRFRPSEVHKQAGLLEREYRTLFKLAGIITPEQARATVANMKALEKTNRHLHQQQGAGHTNG